VTAGGTRQTVTARSIEEDNLDGSTREMSWRGVQRIG